MEECHFGSQEEAQHITRYLVSLEEQEKKTASLLSSCGFESIRYKEHRFLKKRQHIGQTNDGFQRLCPAHRTLMCVCCTLLEGGYSSALEREEAKGRSEVE